MKAILATLFVLSLSSVLTAQSPPLFLGFRPGALFTDPVFRAASCAPEQHGRRFCYPADTVRLLLFRDTLFEIHLDVFRPDTSPADLWDREWRHAATALLGAPDSLQADSDATYYSPPRRFLVAKWTGGERRRWLSDLWIWAGSPDEPRARVQWSVSCVALETCRHPADR